MSTTTDNGRKTQNTQELFQLIEGLKEGQDKTRLQLHHLTEAVASIRRAAVLVTIYVCCYFIFWLIDALNYAMSVPIEQY